MRRITLAATIHDPDERLLDSIHRNLTTLKTFFQNTAIAATSQTSPRTKETLVNNGFQLTETIENEIGTTRRTSLELALGFNCSYLLYCDFDRMLHWVSAYPHELVLSLERIQDYDYVVIGRTKRAFDTHPLVQKETEHITNLVFQLCFGKPYDVTTGTSAMSRAAAEVILKHSRALSNATDTEWPIIVSRFLSDRIGYIEVEGMEFETPDFHQDEIAELGSYEKWLESLSIAPQSWLARLRLSYESVEALMPFLERSEEE